MPGAPAFSNTKQTDSPMTLAPLELGPVYTRGTLFRARAEVNASIAPAS
jgi:hypothetical protein